MSESPAGHAHPGSERNWLPGVEVLRGVAALTVVAHHSWSLSNMPRFPGYWVLEGLGTWGVSLFFLLSGYLLADTFWKAQSADLRVYAIRRLFRIAPAYYVNLIVLFLFFASTQTTFSEQGKRQIAASFTFTQYLFPTTSSSLNVNGALWTLTIEFMLYAFLPLMALAVRRAPLIATLVIASAGLGWKLMIAMNGTWMRTFYFGDMKLDDGIQSLFISRQFVGALPIFALGIGLRWLHIRGKLDWIYDRLPTGLGVSLILVLMGPSLMLLRWVEPASDFHNGWLFASFDLLLMLALVPAVVVATSPGGFARTPFQELTSWLGERSYSIYLWHFPLILAVYERGPLIRPPAGGGYGWRLPLILVLTLGFAAVSYHAVERPGMELGRKLSNRLIRRGHTTERVSK